MGFGAAAGLVCFAGLLGLVGLSTLAGGVTVLVEFAFLVTGLAGALAAWPVLPP